MLFEITTGKPVSDHALTPTHTHTQHEMELLPEALGLSTKQRQPPQSLQRTMKGNDDRGEEARFPVRQHFVLDKMRYHSLYSPRREGRCNRLRHFYSLSFRTDILLGFLPDEYALPRIFTLAGLQLTMYNTLKLASTCKGRFTRIIHGFRLGKVFFTTTLCSTNRRPRMLFRPLTTPTTRLLRLRPVSPR